MKMKEVCELTGLTSRTVRVYIEENLINPSYSENYLGRRIFDFSIDDVSELKSISVLRKFGFSIPEILKIQQCKEFSVEIIKNVCERKSASIDKETYALQILKKLDNDQGHTVSEIADHLSDLSQKYTLPKQDYHINPINIIRRLGRWCIYSLIAFLPILICLIKVFSPPLTAYPTFNYINYICIAVTLFPLAVITLLHFLRQKKKSLIVKAILLLFAVIVFPFSCICALNVQGASMTTDIYNYRKTDAECLANKDLFYQELFPSSPPRSATDEKYYYYYYEGLDYTSDIYAEWKLDREEFGKEIERVRALYEKYSSDGCEYKTVEKGNYVCLFRYNEWYNEPFEKVNDNYYYWIFAYDEQTLTVRYIYCDSLENGADQPYYLSLNW
ncbi:MAG: MerR family transcriptional regulator [Clostridia bacterium]|nr:MerR family transcriptional regulator [Clostridia bacterium]